MSVGEPTGATLCTIHNLAWLFRFVDRIRAAIGSGCLDALRAEVFAVWGDSGAPR